jgi:hypothetical protein
MVVFVARPSPGHHRSKHSHGGSRSGGGSSYSSYDDGRAQAEAQAQQDMRLFTQRNLIFETLKENDLAKILGLNEVIQSYQANIRQIYCGGKQ